MITAAPSWLKYGTPASISTKILDHSKFDEALAPRLRAHELAYSAIVDEVSILSPGVKPAEPLAKVVFLKRSTATPEPHGDVVIYGNGTLLRGPTSAKCSASGETEALDGQPSPTQTIGSHHPRRMGPQPPAPPRSHRPACPHRQSHLRPLRRTHRPLDDWHLDHNDTRDGYLGASHAACNPCRRRRHQRPATHTAP